MAQANPLILDFDRSVLPLPGSLSVDLESWQEEIRFGCRLNSMQRLGQMIHAAVEPMIPDSASIGGLPVVFMGSGDYHHITLLLLEHFRNYGKPLQLVVFDNHPDNMRYPWGVHCGSWVWHASRLPFISQIHVLGITSTDVEKPHAWENHLRNLHSGKVRYWCVGRNLHWMRRLGIRQSQSFPSIAQLLNAFQCEISQTVEPIYLSIDKDVLSAQDAQTNWDQGVMRFEEMRAAIASMKPRIVAADVVGEVSAYRYRSLFKRMLSGMDGQTEISISQLAAWQKQHQQINVGLLEVLS
ncbi:isoleucine--tRNA ligase [Novimethylophilus kurashikiensis]|uniref:Isoleucine--tRNA ligase n=1 Tax=Novimethylophilus kurashikiensis TaxID=1825523 RepID=A0A2R5FAC5_9PROT|nr:arginase family protein [Novimethylophilus kurashikiensis]GBG15180.1 isoleucine--tRNA ligase [Novimethylophilus kurashikiensis]